MRKMMPIIGCLWLCLYAQIGSAVIEVVDDRPIELAGHIDRWVEPPGGADPMAIVQGRADVLFTPFEQRTVQYGVRPSWFCFSVENRHNTVQDVILVLDNLLFHKLEVYYRNDDPSSAQRPTWGHQQAGLDLPWKTRPLAYRFYAFPLSVNPGATLTIYLKVIPVAHTLFAPYLVSTRGLVEITNANGSRVNLFIGFVLGVAVYMLLLAIAAKDWSPTTSYYLCFMFSNLIVQLYLNGELGWLFNKMPRGQEAIGPIAGSVAFFSLLQFTRHVFQTWRGDRWINITLWALSVLQIIALVLLPWFNESLSEAGAIISPAILFYLLGLSLYFSWQQRAAAGYYLFGMSGFLILLILFLLGLQGAIHETFLSGHGLELGHCLQGIAFALMLTEKLRRTRIERALAETRATHAQAESLAKSEFLAVMSHEIRTPMNGVLGMAELISGTELNSTQRYYANTIYNSGRTLLRVLSDILDYSKVEAGKMEIENAPFNLSDLLETTIAPFRMSSAAKKVVLSASIAPMTPIWLIGDTVRLQQILTNLLSNAFKFTERGEVVARIEPGSGNEGCIELCCSVLDTGPGISIQAQARLFQSFAQADASTTRRFGGTGLGLVICKRLVELMGGEITVHSILGAGSTFRFNVWLPIARPTAELHIDLNGLRLLIIEDHLAYQRIVTEQTKSLGMIAESVATLAEARIRLQACTNAAEPTFDLLILDLDIPDGNGVSFASELKQNGFGHIPILLVTASSSLPPIDLLRNTGILRAAFKPTSREQLAKLIAETLGIGQREYADQSQDQICATKEIAASDLSQLRVLVAEDNLVNRQVLLAQLARLGVVPTMVENGSAAVRAVTETKTFDLVLMDCEMPDMDGYQATQEIRAFERHNKLPALRIIALTAHAMEDSEEKSKRAGMNGHLTKPIKLASLRAVLEASGSNI